MFFFHSAFRLLAFCLMASCLSACAFAPTGQAPRPNPGIQMERASHPQGPKEPETITFPSMVTTTELTETDEAKEHQLNEALEEAKAEENEQGGFSVSSHGPKVQIVRFMTRTRNLKKHIKIPETGVFQLVLEAAGSGSKSEIVDGDGTDDGLVRIRLAQNTYETLLHLQGPWRPDSELEIEDPLYYVKDTLSSKKGKLFDINRWLLVGIRPLPVPRDWRSRDGQTLVLNFKTKGVKEFQIAWWSTDEQAAFPPGIKEVDSAGGYLKLPGVGELEVPPGALAQKTVIVLRQKEEVYQFPDNDHVPGPDEIDIAPPMELQPSGLQFLKPAYVRLNVDPMKIKGHRPSDTYYVLFPDAGKFWDDATMLYTAPAKRSSEPYMTFHEWYEVPHFSFVRALTAPRTGYLDSAQEDEFQIAAAPRELPCPNPPRLNSSDNLAQYILKWDAALDGDTQKKQAACEALLNSREDYLPYARGVPPQRWLDFQVGQTSYWGIPLHLKSLGGVTSGRTYSKGDHGRGAELWVDPATMTFVVDSTAHENYHAFQLANVLSNGDWDHITSTFPGVGHDRAWLIESSGRFMGSLSSYKHHGDYVKYGVDSNRILFVYNQIPYLSTLGKGLELLQASSLYDSPDLSGEGPDNRYYRMNLLSLAHTYFGAKGNALQRIHDANVAYLQARDFTNEGAVKALHQHMQLDKSFPLFAGMAALKDYGMGTENAAHFPFIKNTLGNLETVDYTKPIRVPPTATDKQPVSLTANQLQNLRTAYRYVEFPQLSRPYTAYVYLESASTDPALPQTQAEDLAGLGARVLVLKDPGTSRTWKDRKPLVADLKARDGTLYTGKLNLMRKPSKIRGVNRNVYTVAIPIPVGDNRVRLILSTTNPYITADSKKNILEYRFNAYIGPVLWSSRYLNEEEDPTLTKIALKGTGFTDGDTWVVFENRDDLAPVYAKAESVRNLGTFTEGAEDQEIIVQIPQAAKIGGWVYAYVGSAGFASHALAESAFACNMLDNSIRIASERPCQRQ